MATKNRANGPVVPERIYAEASIRSVGGVSLFDYPALVTSDNVEQFHSDPALTARAVAGLRAAGFDVLGVSDITVTIAGPQVLFENAFRTRIVAEERETIKELGAQTTATYLECPDTQMPGLIDTARSELSELVEGVALNKPVYYMAAAAFPPSTKYWHLDVPADVSLGLDADRAHRAAFTGRGIRVAMVDSGWYRHPFFVERGYRVDPVILGPAAANPLKDESGHGTGESANIFAAAPDATLVPIKMSFVNSVGAFNAAVAQRPSIITCSWGSDLQLGPLSAADQALGAAIANAVRQGIIVIFSAGNGHFGFPGQHPDVISAGGAFLKQDGSSQASDYSSGFASRIFPGRSVPDVCGLVGMTPKAIYIMLPVEPGDDIDMRLGGGAFPAGDETPGADGWAAFSGTSAAAPQIAGVCALMKEGCRHLTPSAAREILKRTARDVTSGRGHSRMNPPNGFPAGAGADQATGAGLVDAYKAAALARLRCALHPAVSPVIRPPAIRIPVRHGPEDHADLHPESGSWALRAQIAAAEEAALTVTMEL